MQVALSTVNRGSAKQVLSGPLPSCQGLHPCCALTHQPPCGQAGNGNLPPGNTQTRRGRAGRDKTDTPTPLHEQGTGQGLGGDSALRRNSIFLSSPPLEQGTFHQGPAQSQLGPRPQAASCGLSHHTPRLEADGPSPLHFTVMYSKALTISSQASYHHWGSETPSLGGLEVNCWAIAEVTSKHNLDFFHPRGTFSVHLQCMQMSWAPPVLGTYLLGLSFPQVLCTPLPPLCSSSLQSCRGQGLSHQLLLLPLAGSCQEASPSPARSSVQS
jgi:hypothetical protein